MSLTNYLENALLDHIRGGTAYTQPTSLHVKLHTGNPGEDAADNAAGETDRQTAEFAAASGGTMSLSNDPIEWTNYSTAETVSHFSVWDAATGGNPLGYGALSPSRTMQTGDTLQITSLDWSLD